MADVLSFDIQCESMLDGATTIAALIAIALLFAATLTVLAAILKVAIFVSNRITADVTPVAMPSIGHAIAITLMSSFVNGVCLVGFGAVASIFVGTMAGQILAVLVALSFGIYIMARIATDVLPASFKRALAAMSVATICQFMLISVALKPITTVSDMLWAIVTR